MNDGAWSLFLGFLMLAAFAIGMLAGAETVRTSIRNECERFGQTHVMGKQYVCTALGKTGDQQ